MWRKNQQLVPMLLSDYGIDPSKCHEIELREGEYSKEKCWERCKKLIGGESKVLVSNPDNIPMNVRERCKSVCNKPLLTVNDLDKHHGEPLHIYQGWTTHQNDETFL